MVQYITAPHYNTFGSVAQGFLVLIFSIFSIETNFETDTKSDQARFCNRKKDSGRRISRDEHQQTRDAFDRSRNTVRTDPGAVERRTVSAKIHCSSGARRSDRRIDRSFTSDSRRLSARLYFHLVLQRRSRRTTTALHSRWIGSNSIDIDYQRYHNDYGWRIFGRREKHSRLRFEYGACRRQSHRWINF